MLDAYSAESLKIRGHKATWFLVWLYPISFAVIFLLAVGAGLTGLDERSQPQPLMDWIGDTVVIWFVPGNAMGRYLIAAFVAVVFAGEYGWNTWKLVIPHRSRTALIAAKYGVVLSMLAAAYALTAVISTVGTFGKFASTGDPVPDGVTAGLLAATHGKYALAAVAPLLVTVGYASLAAILTRSTIAALVIAIVVVTVEQLIFNLAPILSIRFPAVIDVLYPVLPGYHMANISEWITEGAALTTPFPDGTVVALSLWHSVAVVAAWIAALWGAAFFAFRRQDIN